MLTQVWHFFYASARLLLSPKRKPRINETVPDLIAGFSGACNALMPFVLNLGWLDKVFWALVAMLSVNADYFHRLHDSRWHGVDRVTSLLGMMHCVHTVLYRIPFTHSTVATAFLPTDNPYACALWTFVSGSLLLKWTQQCHTPWSHALAHTCWHLYPLAYSILLRKTLLEPDVADVVL